MQNKKSAKPSATNMLYPSPSLMTFAPCNVPILLNIVNCLYVDVYVKKILSLPLFRRCCRIKCAKQSNKHTEYSQIKLNMMSNKNCTVLLHLQRKRIFGIFIDQANAEMVTDQH